MGEDEIAMNYFHDVYGEIGDEDAHWFRYYTFRIGPYNGYVYGGTRCKTNYQSYFPETMKGDKACVDARAVLCSGSCPTR